MHSGGAGIKLSNLALRPIEILLQLCHLCAKWLIHIATCPVPIWWAKYSGPSISRVWSGYTDDINKVIHRFSE
jgi:hypothetical protein